MNLILKKIVLAVDICPQSKYGEYFFGFGFLVYRLSLDRIQLCVTLSYRAVQLMLVNIGVLPSTSFTPWSTSVQSLVGTLASENTALFQSFGTKTSDSMISQYTNPKAVTTTVMLGSEAVASSASLWAV
jgi:hypothetical protein